MGTVTELRPSRSHVRSQELEDERRATDTASRANDELPPIERLELAPDWLRSVVHILAAAVVIGVLVAVADAFFGVLATLEGQW